MNFHEHFDEFVDMPRETNGAARPQAPPPPLTIAEWLARDLPEPDYLMGHWLTTTSRALLVAPTGIGKTNFAMGLAMATAAGRGFLQWRGRRPARVLYLDGEMSRRLFKQRLADAVRRLGEAPPTFHALSHEDIENFAPLNTFDGQRCIEAVIEHIGGVDLIVPDSVMCLTSGNMRETEPWAAVIPWVRSLTKRRIGQLWVHHTGHDESRGYGDKSREWQLDTVLHMAKAERLETDVAFTLEFRKARERTPATRDDFADIAVALIGDEWTFENATGQKRGNVSPLGVKFFDALTEAMIDAGQRHNGRQATTIDAWRAACIRRGLIDDAKGHSARTLFAKHKRELIAANRVACTESIAWTV
jgi:hypothetical protein